MSGKLIFVYNADSGLFNTVTDIAHKIFSPSTYNCQLCAMTHSALSMREEWKSFIANIECEIEFLHRDEWIKQYPDLKHDLPAIFFWQNSVELLISAEEIRRCKSIGDLKSLINDKLPG